MHTYIIYGKNGQPVVTLKTTQRLAIETIDRYGTGNLELILAPGAMLEGIVDDHRTPRIEAIILPLTRQRRGW